MDNTSPTTTLIPRRRKWHIAGRMDNNLIITGGVHHHYGVYNPFSLREIWMYHLIRKTWDVYHVPQDEDAPLTSIQRGCAVNIGLYNIYAQGGMDGFDDGQSHTNALWRLSMKAGNSNAFQWKELTFEKPSQTLSPRYLHSGWSYDSKLYIFGGSVPDPNATGYLDEGEDYIKQRGYGSYASRQVYSYDPVHHEWTKVECSGDIPCHRFEHSTTILDDKVWLYGGTAGSGRFLNDLRMLDMNTLIWTRVVTESEAIGLHVLPELIDHTWMAMSDSQLLLYGGMTEVDGNEGAPMDKKPWVFDIKGRSWRQIKEYEKYGCKGAVPTKGLDDNVILVGGHILYIDASPDNSDKESGEESGVESDTDEEDTDEEDTEEQEQDNGENNNYASTVVTESDDEEDKENVLSVSVSPPSLRTLAATVIYKNNVPCSAEDIGVDLYNFIFG